MIGNNPFRKTIGLLGAHLTSSIQENLFVAGKAFFFEDYFTFSADEIKIFVIDPTSFDGDNLVFEPFSFTASSGPVRVDFYCNSVANSDGTLLTAVNRRCDGDPPLTVLRLNPTGVTLGDRFAGDLVPATGQNPSRSTGAASIGALPLELNPEKKYIAQVTNDNGADTLVEIKMSWFEA